jgi:hypothetical protein
MESQFTLPYSQDLATGPSWDREISTYAIIQFTFKTHFNITIQSTHRFS